MVQLVKEEIEIEGDQFLTFCIKDECFGLRLAQTREILEYKQVTHVPLMPEFLVGVINLRGEVVPVIDLGIRLDREPIEIKKRTCVIIIELKVNEENLVLGLLADTVNEVSSYSSDEIEEVPSFGVNIRSDFILGVAKQENDFVVLLDAEKALSPSELTSLVEQEFSH